MSGTLRVSLERALDARCQLMLPPETSPDAEDWIARTFGAIGPIDVVVVPRAHSNWDPGEAYVRFTSSQHAAQAVELLDGTPSFMQGEDLTVELVRPAAFEPSSEWQRLDQQVGRRRPAARGPVNMSAVGVPERMSAKLR